MSALAYTAVDMLLKGVYQRGARLRNSSNNNVISNGKTVLLEGEDEDEIAAFLLNHALQPEFSPE